MVFSYSPLIIIIIGKISLPKWSIWWSVRIENVPSSLFRAVKISSGRFKVNSPSKCPKILVVSWWMEFRKSWRWESLLFLEYNSAMILAIVEYCWRSVGLCDVALSQLSVVTKGYNLVNFGARRYYNLQWGCLYEVCMKTRNDTIWLSHTYN